MNLVGTPSSVSLIQNWDAGTAPLPLAGRFMRGNKGEGFVSCDARLSELQQ